MKFLFQSDVVWKSIFGSSRIKKQLLLITPAYREIPRGSLESVSVI
jgi:hypothetical protein